MRWCSIGGNLVSEAFFFSGVCPVIFAFCKLCVGVVFVVRVRDWTLPMLKRLDPFIVCLLFTPTRHVDPLLRVTFACGSWLLLIASSRLASSRLALPSSLTFLCTLPIFL